MKIAGICSICNNAATLHTCMLCGRAVCEKCYHSDRSVCVQCSRGTLFSLESAGDKVNL